MGFMVRDGFLYNPHWRLVHFEPYECMVGFLRNAVLYWKNGVKVRSIYKHAVAGTNRDRVFLWKRFLTGYFLTACTLLVEYMTSSR
jgi:hypothetical protein